MSDINTTYETAEEDCHVADQYLQLVESSSYNLHTDAEVAMSMGAALGVANEGGKNAILALGDTKPLNATQAKAVSLYHKPGYDNPTGSDHNDDRVVEVANESEDDSKVSKAVHAAMQKLLSGGVTITSDLADKAIESFKHYGKMATSLKADLSKYKLQIKKDPEYHTPETHLSYGSYARFFQASGKHLTDFSEFATVFTTLSRCVDFSFKCGAPLADSNSRLLIDTLGKMQTAAGPIDKDEMETVLDYLRDDHFDVWRNAAADMNITAANKAYRPMIPAALGSPGKTRGPIAALFDNHFLVWTAPVDFDSTTASADSLRADFFGAVMERDKNLDVKFDKGAAEMPLPDNQALLQLIDEAIVMLSVIERYEEFGKRIKDHKSKVETQLKALNAIVLSNTNEGNLTVKHYMPLILSIFRSFTAPHIKLMWQAVRAATLLCSIADMRLIPENANRRYAKVIEKTSDKVIVSLDLTAEPDQVAAKEVGYFNSVLLKLKLK